MITVIFPGGCYSRPVEVKMYKLDDNHVWQDGMTFCTSKKCRCGWPKVEVYDGNG